MQLRDTSAGYGWVSIILHWLTTVVVVLLLFVGSSIDVPDPLRRAAALNLHTSVGVSCYLLLWARVVWRALAGHPDPARRQRGVYFTLGKWTHYAMLVALGIMLISGPAMAWAAGTDIVVFDWFEIPAAAQLRPGIHAAFGALHRGCGIVLFAGIILHLGGVYKHTAFSHDGTLMRIIIPSKVDH